MAQKLGLKTVYYFSPPVSIWGKWNIRRMRPYDLLLCPFQSDVDLYLSGGVKCLWTGHPFSLLEKSPDRKSYRKKLGFDPDRKLVALFPGSRFQEIEKLTFLFLKVAARLQDADPSLQFVLSLAHPDFA